MPPNRPNDKNHLPVAEIPPLSVLPARAFSSETETGSREETRQKKKWSLASDLIRTEALNASDCLQPGAGMDFRLRQDGGLRPEALDQRSHEGPDPRRGDENRRLAFASRLLEAVPHHRHELGQF